MQEHSRRPAKTLASLLLGTGAVLGLGVCAFACKTPPRGEAHPTSASAPTAMASPRGPGLPAASARSPVEPTARAQTAPIRPAPTPDRAALVARSAFPGCPAGLTLQRRRALDGRESLSCARVRGSQVTLHGPSWSWFEGDRLSRIDEYREGVKQGRSTRWFRNGVRRREGQFSGGLREGTWREFHTNGALAEDAHYAHGKLHTLRRRFFENGRKSLEANYDHGVPTGVWSAFYDRDPPNLALTVALQRGREQQEVTGLLPDGTPWKSEPRLDACPEGIECRSPLELLDLEALPTLLPEACAWGTGRNVPANELARVAQAARTAWPKAEPPESSLGPAGCVERIKLSCAPDLDGEIGSELLAEIQYRSYQAECFSASARKVSPTTAVVALSPPQLGASAWSARGFIGYRSFDAPGVEAPSYLEALAFVRLPNGQAALRALESTDGGDCGGRRVDRLRVLRDGAWVDVTSRTLNACNQLAEPEEKDSF